MKPKATSISVRRQIAYGILIIGVLGLLGLPTSASVISINDTVYTSTNATIIPTTATDWWIPYRTRKSGGTAILSITYTSNYPDTTGNPKFTYTNGTSPAAATDQESYYATTWGDPGDPIVTTISVPAGSGQAILWAACSDNQALVPAELKANFSGAGEFSTTSTFLYGAVHQFAIDYTSSQAQNLVLSLTPGKNNLGMYGVIFTVVPEPSAAILLATGLGGLLYGARRKRR